jgi:hypothetical protein
VLRFQVGTVAKARQAYHVPFGNWIQYSYCGFVQPVDMAVKATVDPAACLGLLGKRLAVAQGCVGGTTVGTIRTPEAGAGAAATTAATQAARLAANHFRLKGFTAVQTALGPAYCSKAPLGSAVQRLPHATV